MKLIIQQIPIEEILVLFQFQRLLKVKPILHVLWLKKVYLKLERMIETILSKFYLDFIKNILV